MYCSCVFCFQAEDGIRDAQESRGLGDVYKRQVEDPVAGGYEGFLREVLDVADDIAVFRSDQMRDANVFLASRGGLGEARLPRWEGEPVRTPIWTPPTEPFDVRRAFQIL